MSQRNETDAARERRGPLDQRRVEGGRVADDEVRSNVAEGKIDERGHIARYAKRVGDEANDLPRQG